MDAARAVDGLAERGVRAGALDATTLRLVTHHDVSAEECRRAADALRDVLSEPEVAAA
jgi:threonine aldolase